MGPSTAAAREENRHAAREIAACYDFHLTCIAQDAKYRQYSRYGRTELALASACSATVAEAYIVCRPTNDEDEEPPF